MAEARPHFFPAWLAGPLHGLDLAISIGWLEVIVIAICACYLVVLRCAPALSARRLWLAIVLAHVAALLAPPLFSGDVFGYIGFARLGVLHGLSPYAAARARRPTTRSITCSGGQPDDPLRAAVHPAQRRLVPFGIAGGLWVLKGIATLSSLATVALIWHAAPRVGRSRRAAIAFYGLNPVVLVFAVPGAHNEALIGCWSQPARCGSSPGRSGAPGCRSPPAP